MARQRLCNNHQQQNDKKVTTLSLKYLREILALYTSMYDNVRHVLYQLH